MEKHIITIARGFGSGGKTIAQMLSKTLDIAYYDRELIRLASENSGINEALFNLVDETHKLNLFKKYDNQKILSPDSEDFLSKENLFNFQAEIIRGLADQDTSSIIVGRCAHYLLRDRDDVIRVFIHAEQDHCVKRIMERYGIDEKEATRLVAKTDKARAQYHKYFTKTEWNDARNYDLCLNTSIMSDEECVRMIIEYLKIRDGSKTCSL